MCRDVSMIVMSDFSVRWSKVTGSHSEIIREHHLCDTGLVNQARGEAPFVGIEIVPPEERYDTPGSEWVFSVDSGYAPILPPWWDAARAEEAVRAVLPQWIAECVVLPGQIRDTVYDGQRVYVSGGTIRHVYGGTIRHVYGGTIGRVSGGTVQSVSGGTIQYVSGGTIWDVSGGTVQAVSGGTIWDVSGGTIQYVSGGTIQCVSGGTIQYVYGGTIQSVSGDGTVILYEPIPKIHIEGRGVVLDRTGEAVRARTASKPR